MRKPTGKTMTVTLLAAGAVALGGAGSALAAGGESPADTQDNKQSSHGSSASVPSDAKLSGPVAIKKLPGGGIAVKKVDRDDAEAGTEGKPAEPQKGTPTELPDRGDTSVTTGSAE